jgi:hypothetical protein
MGFLQSMFGSRPASCFVFSDGKRLTPEQYGFVAVKNSYESAREDVQELFGTDQPSASLRMSKAIRKTGLSAAMYFTPLYTAPYIAAAASLSTTSAEVIERVFVGVRDSWSDFRFSSGSSLSAEAVSQMVSTTRLFTASWANDLEEVLKREPEVFAPALLPSLSKAIEFLHTNIEQDGTSAQSWQSEFISVGGVWLGQMLEGSLLSTSQALRGPLNLQYVRASDA